MLDLSVHEIFKKDLKKAQLAKHHAENSIQQAKLEIENANLRLQVVFLGLHVKYLLSLEDHFNLETGEIMKKKEENVIDKLKNMARNC